MPGGLNLGGAFFTLYGDNQQLITTLNHAKIATQAATSEMAKAQKAWADSAIASNAAQKASLEAMARSHEANVAVLSKSVKNYSILLKQLGYDMNGAAKSGADMAASFKSIGATLATLTGFGAIASGALLVRESILGVVDAAQKLNQEQFRLQAQFKELAPMYQQQAAALAELSGRSLSDATAALNEFATLEKNYGLSTEQLIDLQKRSADAAAAKGVSLEEAAKRVGPAIRGEAEAIEFLGFSLQSNYLKALQDVNSEEYKRWQTMGVRQKTQIVLNEFQKQSNEYEGIAAKRAEEAAGAIDKMVAAVENLQAALGKELNPALVEFARLLAVSLPYIIDYTKTVSALFQTGQQAAEQKGLPEWLRVLLGPQLAAVVGVLGLVNQNIHEIIEQNKHAGERIIGPTLEEAIANGKKIDEQAKADNKERTQKHLEQLEKLQKMAIDKQIEQENRAYDDKKAALQADKDAQVEAAQATKDAALAAIAAQKQAAEDLYEVRLAHLQKLKEEELRAVDETHRATLKQLEAEKDAATDASQAQQRRIKEVEEAAVRGSQDRLRAIKDQLEAEDRVRDAARVQEDRALEDQTERQKRDLADRHEAVIEGIETEVKAVRDAAEADVRGVEAEAKKADETHRKKLRSVEEHAKAEEKRHDAAVRGIEQEGQAAEKAHTGVLRQIQAEADAAEKKHDSLTRAIEDEANAAQKRHDTVTRGLDDEAKRAEDAHDVITRGLEDQADAAERAHRTTVDGLDDELDLAKEIHDAAIDALKERKDAEDDRHQTVLDNLEEELRAQLAFVDASVDALDAAQETDKRASKMADLQSALAKAQSGGNAAEVAAAERAIADETADAVHDAAVAQLKAKKDALVEGGKLAKNQADREHQQILDAIDDQKKLADETLDAVEKSVKGRKDAADDALRVIKDEVDAKKRAADDELEQIKDGIDARKRAADDEYTLVKDVLDARKIAADDELKLVKDLLDARKIAADDDLTKIKDGLAARKDALEQEKVKRQEVADDAKTKLEDAERREKDALAKKKIRIEDERDAALAALAVKKKQEDDDNQELQRRDEDALKEVQRRIRDHRTAEDLAAQDKRKEAEETARIEQLAAHDTSDAQIQASKDALEQYTTEWGLRKDAADTLARNETQRIHDVYDDPETGLIPKLKQAYETTKEQYDLRTIEVNKQYDNEKKAIESTFNDPVHGLFKQLEDVHKNTIEGLKDTKKDWEDNFQKPIMEVADKTFADIAENFKRLLKDQKIDVKSGDGGGDDDGDHGGGRGSDKPQGRGPSAGGIPSPWRVTFPYDAPYNGPFSGGAMWSGGPSRHQGIDLALPGPNNGMGQTFGAFQPGTVYWKGFESAGGNGLIIRTDDGLYNYYGHAQRYLVDQGEHVDAGQDIGVLGESGTEGSPHLHYAVRTSVNGGHIDPVPYLTGEGPQLAGDRDLGHGMSIQDGYLVFSLFGRQYRIPLPGGKNAGDPHANADRIETYIRNAAKKRDIDEDVALEVVDSEGGLEPMRIGKFDSGWSFWPFQQHYGGKGYERYGYQAGQGTQFTKDTGWQPEDARAWPASIDWALDYALEHGWGEWYGPLKRGIGVHQGLPGFARGGLIPEPTLLVGKTLGAYAMAGEAAPEWVTPMGGGGQGGHTTVEMPVYIGNREVERFWIDGYNLNVQRGRKFLGTVPR